MTEFSRIQYDYNSRITFNDETTDVDKFVLLDLPNITDTLAINTEAIRIDSAGIVDFGTKLGKGEWAVPVKLVASSFADMQQLIQDFKEALNPDLTELDASFGEKTDFNGYMPLDWTETVGDDERDFRIYVKPLEIPQVAMDSLAGLIRRAVVKFKARQPIKVLQATASLANAGTAANVGTFPTSVIITLTASGATSTSLQLTNSTTGESIFITTAMEDGDVLVIDTFLKSAKLNGTEKRSMIGTGTIWWSLNPGNNTIAISNGANVAMSTAWRSAWPL